MDYFETVKARSSYRGAMKPDQPPLDDLKKIVQAGLDAPSGRNKQTTGFIIITDTHVVQKIHSMADANGSMATAPAYIACHIGINQDDPLKGSEFIVEDCAAAVENILLGAAALGYATVWIDGWLRSKDRAGSIGNWCGLSSERIIRVLIPIGIPVENQKRAEKKSFEERVILV